MVLFEVVEIHVFDLDVFIFFEKFLAGGNIVVVNVNSEDFGVFETVNDAFQWVSGSGSNVKHFFDGAGCFFGSFSDGSVSCSE